MSLFNLQEVFKGPFLTNIFLWRRATLHEGCEPSGMVEIAWVCRTVCRTEAR
jgi:hypothetical protein